MLQLVRMETPFEPPCSGGSGLWGAGAECRICSQEFGSYGLKLRTTSSGLVGFRISGRGSGLCGFRRGDLGFGVQRVQDLGPKALARFFLVEGR